MSDLPISERKTQEAVKQLWEAHNQVFQKKGINLDQLLLSWVTKQKEQFRDAHSTTEFEELCSDGCTPQILSTLLAFIRNSPKFSGFWTLMVGDTKSRKAMTKSLEKAAAALENQFKDMVADDSEEQRKEFEDLDRVPLSRLVAELRFYVSFINLAEQFKTAGGTHSLEEFARFLLTYYVGKSTGRFHDGNVATLFGDVKGLVAYDEAAQRMWRERNYDRLSKQYQKLGDFLVALGAVIAGQA